MAFLPENLKQEFPELCSQQGRLDAHKIAAAFGMSQIEMARSLRTSEWAIAAEPDAQPLQEELARYARVYLLTRFKQVTTEFFREWLRSPIGSLNGESPIMLLLDGESETVAQLVENRVTGQPV
jgi:hypothetical protein